MFDLENINSYGIDIFISPNVEIKRPHLVNIGNHIAIDSGFYCTTQLEIADYVHIGPQVTVIGGAAGMLKIGNFTSISAGCRLICGSDSFAGDGLVSTVVPKNLNGEVIIKPIVIENFASITTNVVVAPGVTIAEGSVIGANSFVNKDTEPWTIYVGNPARPIKTRSKEIMIEHAKTLGYFL